MTEDKQSGREPDVPGGGSGLSEGQSVIEAAGIDPAALTPAERDQIGDILERVVTEDADSDRTRTPHEATATREMEDAGSSTERRGLLPGFGTDGPLPTPGGEEVDLSDVPNIARLAAGATQEVTKYSVEASVRTGTRLLRTAATATSPGELLDESRDIAREEAQRLGVSDLLVGDQRRDGRTSPARDASVASLRERGARLLEQSADVTHDESLHPAYARILDDLACDEARILRLLAREGNQPVVTIRDKGWLPGTSEVVAAGLTMVGAEAGCRSPDRTTTYLNNLERLGVVTIADEPVDDLTRYQVLEAQPDVEAAMNDARRPAVVHRRVQLTPFGVDFCQTCLPVDVKSELSMVPADQSTETEN